MLENVRANVTTHQTSSSTREGADGAQKGRGGGEDGGEAMDSTDILAKHSWFKGTLTELEVASLLDGAAANTFMVYRPTIATDAAAGAAAGPAGSGGGGGGVDAARGGSVTPAVIVQVVRPGVVLTHALEQFTAEALPSSATEVQSIGGLPVKWGRRVHTKSLAFIPKFPMASPFMIAEKAGSGT